jgi:hypothetical protein
MLAAGAALRGHASSRERVRGGASRLPFAEGIDGAVYSDHAAHDADQFIVREIVDLAMPGSLPA